MAKNKPMTEPSSVGSSGLVMDPLDFTQEEIESAQGFRLVEAGTYTVTLKSVTLKPSSKYKPMIDVVCTPVPKEPMLVGQMHDRINLVTKATPVEQREMRNNQLKDFCLATNVNIGEFREAVYDAFAKLQQALAEAVTEVEAGEIAKLGVEFEEFRGLEARAIVVKEGERTVRDEDTGETRTFAEQNKIKKWLPKV